MGINCAIRKAALRFQSFVITIQAYVSKLPVQDSPYLQESWKLLDDYAKKPLPGWFFENRVQAHSNIRAFGKKKDEKDKIILDYDYECNIFTHTAKKFKELGATVYTRDGKTCANRPIWPSKILFDDTKDIHILTCNEDPTKNFIPANRNLVQEIVDEANQEGSKFFCYFWISSDLKAQSLYPDLLCKKPDGIGEVDPHDRGRFLDITAHVYRDIIRDWLLELASFGTDGAYFDVTHSHPLGGWGTHIQKEFETVTGKSAPSAEDDNDPLYRAYLDFTAYKIEETFLYWKKAVEAVYPHFIFIISVESLASLVSRKMTSTLASICVCKSEYQQALLLRLNAPLEDANKNVFKNPNIKLLPPDDDIWMAFGWKFLRESAGNLPSKVWCRGFDNKEHAVAAAASLMTYGDIADIQATEGILAPIPPADTKGVFEILPHATPKDALEAAFQLGKLVSPYLKDIEEEYRFFGIHFSELSRNRRGGDLEKMWREVLWPTLGPFETTLREGYSSSVVTDYQLEKGELQGYQVLFVPSPLELTALQRKHLHQFVLKGGIVLKNEKDWEWSFAEAGKDFAKGAFKAKLTDVFECIPPPFQLVTSAPKVHFVPYQDRKNNRVVIQICNDFSFVQLLSEDNIPKCINPAPAPVTDAKVVVRALNPPDQSQVYEVITGAYLPIKLISGGYEIEVSAFQVMAILILQF